MKRSGNIRMIRQVLAIPLLLTWAYSPAEAQAPQTPAAGAAVQNPDQSKLESAHLPRTVEDFGTLTLDKSQLKAEPPVPISHAAHEKFTFERIRLQWRELDPIDLYVLKPAGVAKPPVIIYLYSYPTGVEAFSNDRWAERAVNGGYAAVGFLPALTGDRFQMRPMKQTFLTELPESLGTTVHDVQMVLNYLQTRNDLDMNNVGALGTGSGATIAILAAAADPRIKALDLMEPWGDWPNWGAKSNSLQRGEREPLLKPEFLAKMAPLDPVKWLPKLTTQKIMLQFIDTDDELNKTAKADLDAAAAGAKNIIVYHYPSRLQHMAATSGGRRFEWLKSQLHPSEQASAATQSQK
jgi:hypothetical protein